MTFRVACWHETHSLGCDSSCDLFEYSALALFFVLVAYSCQYKHCDYYLYLLLSFSAPPVPPALLIFVYILAF